MIATSTYTDSMVSAAGGFATGFITMIGGFILFYGLYLVFLAIKNNNTATWPSAVKSIACGAVILIIRILFLS